MARKTKTGVVKDSDDILLYAVIGFFLYSFFKKGSAQAGTVAGHHFVLSSDQQSVTDTANNAVYQIANDSGFQITTPDWSLSSDGSVLTEVNTQNVYTFQGA